MTIITLPAPQITAQIQVAGQTILVLISQESFDVQVEFYYHKGDPGNIYGDPNDCWPPEPAYAEIIRIAASSAVIFQCEDYDGVTMALQEGTYITHYFTTSQREEMEEAILAKIIKERDEYQG